MIFKLGLRSILCAFAVAMVMTNLFGMLPAAAAANPCQTDQVVGVSNHHDALKSQPGCCDAMHCCPMVPVLPAPGLPSEVRLRPHVHLEVDQPLLLVTSIDPPPRSPVS